MKSLLKESKERFRVMFNKGKENYDTNRVHTEEDIRDIRLPNNTLNASKHSLTRNQPENISQYYSRRESSSGLNDKIK